MAEELLIQKSTLTEIGDAIRAREGSTGDIPVKDLATRILAIKGGVEVKRATGTFTPNSSGQETVECGFKPDLVFINVGGSYTRDAYKFILSAAVAFAEDSRESESNAVMETVMPSADWAIGSYSIYATRDDTGFVVHVYKEDGTAFTGSCNYVAVNYTSEGTGSSGVIYPVAEEGAF